MQALGIDNLPAAQLISLAKGGGRISLPVSSDQVIYANFEHVTGVASPTGSALSIDKLRILNTLIDRLLSMKKDAPVPREDAGHLTQERIDALLEQYGKEAHSLAARSGPYAPSLGLVPGSLISLAA
jgi:hypothetical protein